MSGLLRPGQPRRVGVRVLTPDYSGVIGPLPGYLSVSVTWQRLGVGTGTLVVPEQGAPALQLLAAIDRVVPVVIDPPGYPRWTGRVQRFESEKATGQVGRITATLIDETQWLKKILAAPVPGATWSAQTTAEHDVRTGPIETVAKSYVTANINRLAAEGRPTPLVVVPAPVSDTSPTVNLQARNIPLQTLLVDALRANGRDLTATLWLPGDPQPPGLTLTAPRVVIDVVTGRDRPYVNFTDRTGGLTSRKLSGTHPEALGVLVQGPGEKTARTFAKVMATDGRVAALGMWGFPEDTVEATDTGADLTARGLEKAAELAGAASVVPEVDDRRPWVAGPDGDYWVNDVVRATFSGVSVEDRIERFTVTHDRNGFRGIPQFGAGRETETADRQLAKTIAQVRRDLALMQARR